MSNQEPNEALAAPNQDRRLKYKDQAIQMPFKIKKPVFIKVNSYARSGHWTEKQRLKFAIFMDFHRELFRAENKKHFKFFKYMSEFIKTRSPNQCRSHHQKIGQYQDIPKLISEIMKDIGSEVYQKSFRLYYEQLEKMNIVSDTLEYPAIQNAQFNEQNLQNPLTLDFKQCKYDIPKPNEDIYIEAQEKEIKDRPTNDSYKEYAPKKNRQQEDEFPNFPPTTIPFMNTPSLFNGLNINDFCSHMNFMLPPHATQPSNQIAQMEIMNKAMYHYSQACKFMGQLIAKNMNK